MTNECKTCAIKSRRKVVKITSRKKTLDEIK